MSYMNNCLKYGTDLGVDIHNLMDAWKRIFYWERIFPVFWWTTVQIDIPVLAPHFGDISSSYDSSIEREFLSNKDPFVIELSSFSSES